MIPLSQNVSEHRSVKHGGSGRSQCRLPLLRLHFWLFYLIFFFFFLLVPAQETLFMLQEWGDRWLLQLASESAGAHCWEGEKGEGRGWGAWEWGCGFSHINFSSPVLPLSDGCCSCMRYTTTKTRPPLTNASYRPLTPYKPTLLLEINKQ